MPQKDDKLDKYRNKRKPGRTPEPSGVVSGADGMRFVVQRHDASRLHYDFRLEMDGVLKSWAVPKGVPEVPGVRRLAVEVEDHPVDYMDFEGVIPEGNYGAGTVRIWDRGTYETLEREKDKFKVRINGEKLKGEYALIKLKSNPRYSGEDNWLFFRI